MTDREAYVLHACIDAPASPLGQPDRSAGTVEVPPRLAVVPRRAVYVFGCPNAEARGAEVDR
jgi:hypothetical protein